MKRFLLVNNHVVYRNSFSVPAVFFITSFFTIRGLKFLSLTVSFFICFNCFSQQTEEQKIAEYKKTIGERSAKIVKTLDIADAGKFEKIQDIISNQYFDLNLIHEQFKTTVAGIKSRQLEKTTADEELKRQEEKKSIQLMQQHSVFITHLKKELTDDQLEKVKNGMTYNVLNVTYTAYQEMLLNLTTEQKAKIYNWLVEARELAMDEGSSDDKHKVFGKYKGRINNYLSAQGYDMKKEEKAWQTRIKEKQNSEKQSS